MSATNPPTYYFSNIDFNDNFYSSSNSSINDDLIVHKAGTETITGNKTFTGSLNVSGDISSGNFTFFSGSQVIFNNGIGINAVGADFFGQTQMNTMLVTSTDISSSVPYSSNVIAYQPSVVNTTSLFCSNAYPSPTTFKFMTWDPAVLAGTGSLRGVNYVFGCAFNLPKGFTILNMGLIITATTTATVYPLVYSSSGTLLASGSGISVGAINVPHKFAFTSSYTTTSAGIYFVAFYQTGATMNTLDIPNPFTTFQTPVANTFNLRCGYISSGTIPSTLTGTLTQNATIPWIGLN